MGRLGGHLPSRIGAQSSAALAPMRRPPGYKEDAGLDCRARRACDEVPDECSRALVRGVVGVRLGSAVGPMSRLIDRFRVRADRDCRDVACTLGLDRSLKEGLGRSAELRASALTG